MRLDVTQVQGNGFTEVTASHKGESLVFATMTYGKVKLQDPQKIFDEINQYWEWMGDKCGDPVFEAYRTIKDIFDNALDTLHLNAYIKKGVSQLYRAMPMDTLSQWLLTRGNLYIPSDIKETLQKGSRYPRLDQTYLKDDYINLAVLALALRPVIPIWGEFIDPIRQSNTNDLHKEMEAVGLLSDTEVVGWPLDKPAFDKILTYIRITTDVATPVLGNLYRGIGTAEIPMWLLAKVLIRRLTIVPLTDHSATHSIIANVYNYTRSNMKPSDRRTTDRVADKRQDKGVDDDDKTSFLEGYKVKQRVATGDIVLFNVYSENIADIIQTVDPTVDMNLLNQTMECLPHMETVRIFPHQIRLAQWVLSKGYSPRAFYHINKTAVNRLLAGAQALLWHWGFLDVASLMQVNRISSTEQDIPGITLRPKGSSRISRKYDEDLATLYPHTKPQKVGYKTPVDPNARSANYAALGINNVTRDIHRYDWYYLGPDTLRDLIQLPKGRSMVVLPPKLKDQITEIVIKVATINT